MQENPVAFDVILAHVLYPVAVQSQGCDAEHRITPTDMKTILKALVESLGCPQGTGAHSAFSLQIEEAIGEDYFAEADLSEIPERYLSTDPNFCTSDELAQIKAANWEWVNADE